MQKNNLIHRKKTLIRKELEIMRYENMKRLTHCSTCCGCSFNVEETSDDDDAASQINQTWGQEHSDAEYVWVHTLQRTSCGTTDVLLLLLWVCCVLQWFCFMLLFHCFAWYVLQHFCFSFVLYFYVMFSLALCFTNHLKPLSNSGFHSGLKITFSS